jgi:hypothetical protein
MSFFAQRLLGLKKKKGQASFVLCCLLSPIPLVHVVLLRFLSSEREVRVRYFYVFALLFSCLRSGHQQSFFFLSDFVILSPQIHVSVLSPYSAVTRN